MPEKVVFTNGCFDVLHAGHVDLLDRARVLGDRLIVGINSDHSVRSIKGPGRPVNGEDHRRTVLLALRSVDEVRVFDEPTPATIIAELRPDVLVKGGDWKEDEIVGADLVRSYGGRVVTIPLVDGLSSTDIIERSAPSRSQPKTDSAPLQSSLAEHKAVFEKLADGQTEIIERCVQLFLETLARGNKVLICGNGGSAADAQHLAAEFVGRYETERRGLPAIALTTDTSALTALANDYGFERVFARQVEALGVAGDCLVAISTSGNSPNIVAAVMAARKKELSTIGMTGEKGKKLASLCDLTLMVPSERTARIQEAHITVAHIWCEMIDIALDQ